MAKRLISTGSTITKQRVLLILLGLFFTSAIGFAIIAGDLEIWYSMLFVMILFTALGWNTLTFAEIYVTEDSVVYERITGTKSRPLTEIKSVNEALRAANYYLEFADNSKVYFQIDVKSRLNGLERVNPGETIADLKEKFNIK